MIFEFTTKYFKKENKIKNGSANAVKYSTPLTVTNLSSVRSTVLLSEAAVGVEWWSVVE